MLRVKVSLKNGLKKSANIENKEKCAQWLNLLHEEWVLIEISQNRKINKITNSITLREWIKTNG